MKSRYFIAGAIILGALAFTPAEYRLATMALVLLVVVLWRRFWRAIELTPNDLHSMED